MLCEACTYTVNRTKIADIVIFFSGLFGAPQPQISGKLYPEKLASARETLDPIVHCCISNLTLGNPNICVYEGSKVG